MKNNLKIIKKALKIKLDKKSKDLRKIIVSSILSEGRGHLGSALSIVEVIRVIYEKILKINKKNLNSESRDYFILSKGHGCLGLYAVLNDIGVISKKELLKCGKFDAQLAGHPEHIVSGVEASTGSLGNGLPIAVGIALGLKLKKKNNKVVVLTGDGEINEGSVWESFLHISKHRLDNLYVVIDYNKFQSYDQVKSVVSLESLYDKIKSFNLNVFEVNGHDMYEIEKVFKKAIKLKNGKSSVIISHSVKGKGIKSAENNRFWHHKSNLTEEEIRSISEDLL
ncbi:transketolase [Candidatus Pelagibacter sp.]|nr:transketolase [Candidatus Pelagibacter sp.]